MSRISHFVFARMQGKRGETLPFSRWDILLSVILGVAFMAALAYGAETDGGWTLKRIVLLVGTTTFVLCTAQNRRVVLGCAFGLVAFRMGIGILGGSHLEVFIAGTAAAGCGAWFLLHCVK